jgi:hypothetical protein
MISFNLLLMQVHACSYSEQISFLIGIAGHYALVGSFSKRIIVIIINVI